MFREPEGKKWVETDRLAADPEDDDEVKMYDRKGYGAKDTYGNFSSANTLIAGAAPKPLSFNMDSISIFPTKKPPFE